jgi:hypothetical protein
MNWKNIGNLLKIGLHLWIIVILFIIFSWYGVIGYILFVIILAIYILIKRREQYMSIIKYGSNQLLKLTGGGKKHGGKKTDRS